MPYTYTTQAQVRAAFWESHPHFDEQARLPTMGSTRAKHRAEYDVPRRNTFKDSARNMLAQAKDLQNALPLYLQDCEDNE